MLFILEQRTFELDRLRQVHLLSLALQVLVGEEVEVEVEVAAELGEDIAPLNCWKELSRPAKIKLERGFL